jgi:hypothetical protein
MPLDANRDRALAVLLDFEQRVSRVEDEIVQDSLYAFKG